jgi:CheY-like chemotaxis protein
MVGMDGFALLKWLRNDPRWRNLVCVILTNSDVDSDKEKAYRLGANSYLVKPTNFKSYTEMLKLIEGYWSLNQVPAAPAS